MNVDLVQLAGHRGRLHERPTVDQVTAEVIRGAMETICFEMATYVSRTATTPILNQSNERNATILDAKGRLAALSVGIPQFMLTSTLPVRFALSFQCSQPLARLRQFRFCGRRAGQQLRTTLFIVFPPGMGSIDFQGDLGYAIAIFP